MYRIRTQRHRWWATLALAVGLGACAPGMAPPPQPQDPGSTELRPGDMIRLTIWREPDMSGEYPVSEAGVAVLPRIGPYPVAGKAPAEARAEILARLDEYLVNPSIEIQFLRRINILGAVREPGLYPVDPTMTIADALALAGGTRPEGKLDEIQLLRNGEVVTARIRQGAQLQDTPIRSGDQLFVPERSWLARNTGIVTTIISATVSLAIALMYVSR